MSDSRYGIGQHLSFQICVVGWWGCGVVSKVERADGGVKVPVKIIYPS